MLRRVAQPVPAPPRRPPETNRYTAKLTQIIEHERVVCQVLLLQGTFHQPEAPSRSPRSRLAVADKHTASLTVLPVRSLPLPAFTASTCARRRGRRTLEELSAGTADATRLLPPRSRLAVADKQTASPTVLPVRSLPLPASIAHILSTRSRAPLTGWLSEPPHTVAAEPGCHRPHSRPTEVLHTPAQPPRGQAVGGR